MLLARRNRRDDHDTVTRRLAASDPAESPRRARPLRSLALSPPSTDANGARTSGGVFVLGVTAPDDALCARHGTHTCDPALGVPAGSVCVDHGERNCGAGKIVLLGNDPAGGQSAILAAPPGDLPLPSPFLSGSPPMLPLRALSPAREVAFMGRDACSTQSHRPLKKKLALFTSEAADIVLVGRETILRDGRQVGYLTSGGYGYTVGKPIGYGYVRNGAGVTDDYVLSGRYELVVAKDVVKAQVYLAPLYDPANARIRG